MSVIIRLQNLPWSANALDIRQYFHGLSIPEGGVHIVGGELGDAFIAFSTDEDARQAFARDNGKINEVQINLKLSSRTEMQKVIEAARAKTYAAFMQTTQMPLPAAVPVVPSAVPDFKKDGKERDSKTDKRDKKRSRSRSRDRKDRRDRRRDRDRSRSRSRERRDRRRRSDRSRSRGRSRSRERKSRDRRRSDDSLQPKLRPEVWSSNTSSNESIPPSQQTALLSNFISNLDEARKNLTSQIGVTNIPPSLLNATRNNNGFPQQFNRPRDSWPPQNDSYTAQNPVVSRSENMGRPGPVYPSSRYPPRIGPYQEREIPADTCVKLQPFYGGYSEIRRFFQGCFISNTGIKFINDDFGHRTGIVYIQFGHPQGKSEALRRNSETLNGVKVEVVHIDDEEFEQAVDRYLPETYDEKTKYRSRNISKYFNNKAEEIKNFTSLTVDDLPTYVKEQDILKMFSPRPLISLILTSKPRGGHIAYVKFGSADEARKALEETPTHTIEGKPVTVKACGDQDFEAVNQQHDVNLESNHNQAPELETDCLNINGLPLQTNTVEVTDFFSDIGVRPLKIHLINNRLGFTGQAFCEFNSIDDAAQALKKDGSSFGSNVVTIEAISREEMEEILLETQGNGIPAQPLVQQAPQRPMIMNQNQMNSNNRSYYPRGGYDGGRGGPRFMGNRAPPRSRYINQNQEDAPAGCTVYMDNVPYKAGTNEILEFFDGYDITNNVSRRFNPNNTPSAEAKVVFNSMEEAYRAVQEKNGQKIWDRPIFLKQV